MKRDLETSLLAAIYADPANDGPRLVYADYLLERGDPRGELIMLQCRGTGAARVKQLLAKHKHEWLGPLNPAILETQPFTFERGFLATATVCVMSGTRTRPDERDRAVRAISEHPAWATLRRVKLGKLASKMRPELLGHLTRLGVEHTTLVPRLGRERALQELERCVAGGANDHWHGERGLGSLQPGMDRKLVERAMRVTLPWSPAACLNIPDEYMPLAWRILAKITSPDAAFLHRYAEGGNPACVREGCAWLTIAYRVDDDRRDRRHLTWLCANPSALTAARAAVAKHGVQRKQLLAILAYDGSEASAQALRKTVAQALSSRDEGMDVLNKWLVPFARGAAMAAVVAALRQATVVRAQSSPVLVLMPRFGAKGTKLDFDFTIHTKQVYRGLTRKATAWIELHSHAVPSVKAAIIWNLDNSKSMRWQDGKVTHDKLKLRGPKNLDDLPRWLAASATALGVRWDPSTIRVTSSLLGKARAAAVAWLLRL